MRKNTLNEIISEYEYISFDIFDTLISRNLEKPTDVFKIMQNEYKKNFNGEIENWVNIRIDAESKARKKSSHEEITLKEIYDCIELDKKIKKKLYDLEIQIEVELSSPIVKNLEILNNSIEAGKKIILTSDMYLPKDVIEKILTKNNIKYLKLYLSSEKKLTKSTGNLFKFIINDLKIENTKIIHLGDNYTSDYVVPMMLGIKAIHLKRNTNIKLKNKDICKDDEFYYKCLKCFLNENINDSNGYFYNKGYQTLGPLLYGYSTWLKQEFEKENFDNIFFLSRDGYIMQKAFENVSDIKTEYMYASRRALIVPTIWKYEDLESLKKNMKFPRQVTIKSMLKKMGLDSEKYKDIVEKYGYKLDDEILEEDISESNLKFYGEIKEDIYKNSKKEYENLIAYLKKHNFNGKTAIIDIGWFGNMQYAINNIVSLANMDVDLYGYYVGIVPYSEKQDVLNMKAFLFDKNNEDFYYKEVFFNSLFELIFSAQHGSVKKYTDDVDKIEFYPYEYENSNDKVKIVEFQKGAIDFVKDFANSKLSNYIEFNKYLSTYDLFELGNYPSKEDIKMFENIDFFDDDTHKLIETKSLLFYALHLKQFKNEFHNAHWKPAFLRKLLKINLDYYNFVYKYKAKKDKNK